MHVRTFSSLLAFLLLTTSLMAPPAAFADDRRGGEVGFLVGFMVPDEALTNDPDTSTEFTLGARGGSVFAERWGWFVDGLVSDVSRKGPFGDATTVIGRTGFDAMFGPGSDPRWFVTLAGGWTAVEFDNAKGQDFHRPLVSLGFGQRLNIGGRKHLRWELRADHTLDDPGLNGEDLVFGHFVVGMVWGPGGSRPSGRTAVDRDEIRVGDADGDGIPDRKDRCPATPMGALVGSNGCPTDGDEDGVPDGIDRCPETERGDAVGPDGCPGDEDGDGVPDFTDVCPGTPAGASADEWGCPKDNDRDGVFNGIDRCPDTLWGVSVDASGCGVDTDGDRVFDGLDRCPDTPAGATVDGRGCPLDSDGDGVDDLIDRCPDTPAGSAVDSRGCPTAALDGDADGIVDDRDACPGTPRGTAVDARGCPVLFESGQRSLILEGVTFETNSARLTRSSRQVLDRVADSLEQWPEVRVEIGGHTDASGSDALNLRLSTQRAEAVRDYLAGQGISAGRLVARGYGESRPIGDNSTVGGRATNRRVELVRLD